MPVADLVYGDAINGNAASISVSTDASLAEGDLRLVFISVSNTTISTPSNWTLVSSTVIATSRRIYSFRRTHSESDPSSYSFTLAAANNYSCIQAAVRGHDPAAPINAGPTVNSSATSGTTLTAPSVTTTAADTLLLTFFASINNQSNNTLSTPSEMTLVDSQAGDGSTGHSCLLSREGRPSSGTTGTRVSTSFQSAPWGALSVAIAPSAATTGSLAGTLPVATASLVGAVSAAGVLAGTLPVPASSSAGAVSATAALVGTLPAPTSSSAGAVSATAVLTGTLPVVTGFLTGTATEVAAGALAGTFPIATAAFTAEVANLGLLSTSLGAPSAALAVDLATGGVLVTALSLPLVHLLATGGSAGPVYAGVPVRVSELLVGSLTREGVPSVGSPREENVLRAGEPTRVVDVHG